MNGYEQILCQIPVEGYYLGYKCPVYGISITYSTYKLLKAMGVPIEPYDPKAEMEKQAKIVEAIKEEIPQVKETVNVKVESTPVETISEHKQKVIVEPTEEPRFQVIEKQVSDDDPEEYHKSLDSKIGDILANTTRTEEENIFDKVPETERSHFIRETYTHEELAKMPRAQLIGILTARGYTGRKDDNAPKSRDKREELIRKILNTQL